MSQININNVTFTYDSVYHNIFEQVSFQIDTDWKLGFIGRNGRGKTTFLNLLMGNLEYKGTITSNVSFDYFPFTCDDSSIITKELMKEKIAPFYLWESRLKELEKSSSEEQLEEYGTLLDLYILHDGYVIEELIEKEIRKLGVKKDVLERPFSTLSNGERTKIMLAALFLKKNHFLLIDEPTNHLDMEGRSIISDYLKGKKGFILVSHDRTLLDEVIDHVLSINKCSIEVQKGNYSSWKQNKDETDKYQIENNKQLKKEISHMEQLAKRTAGWSDQVESSKIGNHSGDRGYIGHKAAKMMKKAKTFEKRQETAIEEKKGLLKDIEKNTTLKMNLLPYPKQKLIEVKDLTLHGYTGKENILTSPIHFTINKGDRIWLKGANGCGKSSLLKLLLGEQVFYSGDFYIGSQLAISYVCQDTSFLSGSLSEYRKAEGINETIFKTVLSQLNFSSFEFSKNMNDYSEGQKKKILLAKSLSIPSHIFFWDEPLNFIDILSRIQLEELILEYKPTMLFVEHDKTFSSTIATKIVEL